MVSSECGKPPENVANTIEDEFKNNDESSLKRNYSYSFTGGVKVKLDKIQKFSKDAKADKGNFNNVRLSV